MQSEFAVRLKSVRLSYGLSQASLGEALGVGQAYIAKWEAAAYMPSGGVLKRVAAHLQVSKEWLAKGTGPVYTGVVFLPFRTHLTRHGFNRTAFSRIMRFLMDDGGRVLLCVVSQGDKGEGMFLFSRGDELFLFLPFRSAETGRGPHGVAEEMLALLEESLDREAAGGVVRCTGGGLTVRVCVLPDTDFRLIAPSTPLPLVERLISISIPEGLKAAHGAGAGWGMDESRILMKLLSMSGDEAPHDSSLDGPLAHLMEGMKDERALRTLLAVSPLLRARVGVDGKDVITIPLKDLKERIARMGWTRDVGGRITGNASCPREGLVCEGTATESID